MESSEWAAQQCLELISKNNATVSQPLVFESMNSAPTTHKYHGLLSFPQGGTPETFRADAGIDSCLYGKRACALPKHIFVFMRRFMSGMGSLVTKFIQVLPDNGYATNAHEHKCSRRLK